jgi:hypothetical protein
MTLRADVVASKFSRRQHANNAFGKDFLAFGRLAGPIRSLPDRTAPSRVTNGIVFASR